MTVWRRAGSHCHHHTHWHALAPAAGLHCLLSLSPTYSLSPVPTHLPPHLLSYHLYLSSLHLLEDKKNFLARGHFCFLALPFCGHAWKNSAVSSSDSKTTWHHSTPVSCEHCLPPCCLPFTPVMTGGDGRNRQVWRW